MADVSTVEPASFRAGDTVTWNKTLDEYPAGTWTLAYKLLNATTSASATVTTSGTTHVATLTAATTAALAAGTWTLVGTVTSGALRYTVYSGTVEVLPDLAAATAYDGRSAARQALDALKAAYYAWTASGGAGRKTLTIRDRSVTFESPGEMVERIEQLEQEVARERALEAAVNGGVAAGRVYVRM